MYKDDDVYYVFIEDHENDNEIVEKFVIKIYRNSHWNIEAVRGPVPYDLENEKFDREDVIDDILEYLRDSYDYIQEINFFEIDDYMEE